MTKNEKLLVEVWSDVVCPFCYIGKRNYEKALSEFENKDDVVLQFKSFQLDPDFIQNPGERHDLTKSLAQKYRRSEAEIEQMQNQITATAKAAGLVFNFDKVVTFNTFNAHRLLQIAGEKGFGNALHEAFFAAYFTRGRDLGSPDVLKEEALRAGLTENDIERALSGDDYAYKVNQDIQEAGNLGISGVPFFVFNRKYGVSGAQPPQVFLDTLKAAYEEWKKSKTVTLQTVAQGQSCDVNGNCS